MKPPRAGTLDGLMVQLLHLRLRLRGSNQGEVVQHVHRAWQILQEIEASGWPTASATPLRAALAHLEEVRTNGLAIVDHYCAKNYNDYVKWASTEHLAPLDRAELLERAEQEFNVIIDSPQSSPFGYMRAFNNRADLLLWRLRHEGGRACAPQLRPQYAVMEKRLQQERDELLSLIAARPTAEFMMTVAQIECLLAHSEAQQRLSSRPFLADLNL